MTGKWWTECSLKMCNWRLNGSTYENFISDKITSGQLQSSVIRHNSIAFFGFYSAVAIGFCFWLAFLIQIWRIWDRNFSSGTRNEAMRVWHFHAGDAVFWLRYMLRFVYWNLCCKHISCFRFLSAFSFLEKRLPCMGVCVCVCVPNVWLRTMNFQIWKYRTIKPHSEKMMVRLLIATVC